MPRAGDLIVVHFPETVEVGYRFERRRSQWPLHITMAPWFSAPEDADVQGQLQAIAHTAGPFTYTVGGVEYFGARSDVPVNVIEHNERLIELERNLITVLQGAGVLFMPGAHIESFRPHITHHGMMQRHEGETLRFDDFHAVKLDEGNMCEVYQRYPLGL